MVATSRKSRTGSIQGKVFKYLGNRRSARYKEMKAAIARRNEIKMLQSRYSKLMALYKKALEKQLELEETEKTLTNLEGISVLSRTVSAVKQEQERLWSAVKSIASRLGVDDLWDFASTG